jgi:hypothetical protein
MLRLVRKDELGRICGGVLLELCNACAGADRKTQVELGKSIINQLRAPVGKAAHGGHRGSEDFNPNRETGNELV